jgi:hypothetical protein
MRAWEKQSWNTQTVSVHKSNLKSSPILRFFSSPSIRKSPWRWKNHLQKEARKSAISNLVQKVVVYFDDNTFTDARATVIAIIGIGWTG